jgi:PLP dependent protein
MTSIPANLQVVKTRIVAACNAAGRDPGTVSLLAVSKTWPGEAVREAAACGQHAFGESYLQEALAKIPVLADLALDWHFIGPIQSNKPRAIAENFAWAHGIDRQKIAERLSQQRPAGMRPLQVCVQVNVSGEASKSGVAPEETLGLCRAVAGLPGLRLRGLMAIPEPTDDMALAQARFRLLRELRDQARRAGLDLDTLSMGMSDDLEAAIMEGATLVRVGTAIFGSRTYT